MDSLINWLQSISVGLSNDKKIIRIELKSSTDNPVTGKPDSSHTVYIPAENYHYVINILLNAGKYIEKEFAVDLCLDDMGDCDD